MSRWPNITICSFLLWATFAGAPAVSHAQDSNADERLAKIQAAFLLNFARYTTWPPAAFADHDSPLVITVAGDARLLPYLQQIAATQKVGNRSIVVHTVTFPDADAGKDRRKAFTDTLRASHMVYIAAAEAGRALLALRALRGADVLTVGGSRGFVDIGGMLELRRRRDRITFAANVDAIEATHLRVSSKLLQLAEWVKGGD